MHIVRFLAPPSCHTSLVGRHDHYTAYCCSQQPALESSLRGLIDLVAGFISGTLSLLRHIGAAAWLRHRPFLRQAA